MFQIDTRKTVQDNLRKSISDYDTRFAENFVTKEQIAELQKDHQVLTSKQYHDYTDAAYQALQKGEEVSEEDKTSLELYKSESGQIFKKYLETPQGNIPLYFFPLTEIKKSEENEIKVWADNSINQKLDRVGKQL